MPSDLNGNGWQYTRARRAYVLRHTAKKRSLPPKKDYGFSTILQVLGVTFVTFEKRVKLASSCLFFDTGYWYSYNHTTTVGLEVQRLHNNRFYCIFISFLLDR